MSDSNPRFFPRRNWLGVAPAGLAASAASGVWARAYTSASANTPAPSEHSGGARTYNVRDFGPKGDGKALDAAAVQAAIDAWSRDQGGTVVVPAGDGA